MIVFDITGDPPLEALLEAVPRAIGNLTMVIEGKSCRVFRATQPIVGFLASDQDPPRPDPVIVFPDQDNRRG